jgi:hypothetical protein
MVTAQDLQNKYYQRYSAKSGRSAHPDRGRVFPVKGQNRTLSRIEVNQVASYAMKDAANQHHGIITETQAAQDLTLLENLSFSAHKDVKGDDRWRHLYHRAQRRFEFMND